MGRHSAPLPLKTLPPRKPRLLHISMAAVATSLVLSSVAVVQMLPASTDISMMSALAPDKENKYDCGDFTYQEDAQHVLDADPSDPNRLDEERPAPDGIACNYLPHRASGDVYLNDVPGGATPGIPEFVPGSPEATEKDVTPSLPTTRATAPTKPVKPKATTSNTDVEPADPVPTKPVTSDNPKCINIKFGIKTNVYAACNQILSQFPQVKFVGGLGSRPSNPTSCHPKGLALDIMTYADRGLGDKIYAYVISHKKELQATTILWKVAAHYDHVHISFEPCQY